jgi:ABC-type transport system substrate-binding protein
MTYERMTRRQMLHRSAATAGGIYLNSWMARARLLAAPARGGTLTVARPLDSLALDPYRDSSATGTWVYGLIFEPLLTLTPDMKVRPGLASASRITSPTSVRLTLRRGVKFHDGTPLDARAVKAHFDRMFNASAPGVWASFAGPIKAAEVVGDYTVRIETKEPFSPILANLAGVHGGIVSPTAVRRWGEDFGRNPVGTGPFKFVEWRSRDRIVLARNDDYWGEKPALERIVFRVIPEASARMIALRTGEVDMVLVPPVEELPALERDRNFTVSVNTSTRTVFIIMNMSQSPMDDERVRRALIVGTNRKGILDNIVQGAGSAANDIMAAGIFGHAPVRLDTRYPYDPRRARELLGAADFRPGRDGIMERGGSPLVLSMISSRGRFPKDAEIAEAFQAQMREIGVRVDLQIPEYAVVFSVVRAATTPFHLILNAWGNVTGDADHTMTTTFRSDQVPPVGWNMFRYNRPEADRLIDLARVSLSQDERRRLYERAQEIIAQDLPFIPLYNMNNVVVMRSYVKGFVPHPVEYALALAPLKLER